MITTGTHAECGVAHPRDAFMACTREPDHLGEHQAFLAVRWYTAAVPPAMPPVPPVPVP